MFSDHFLIVLESGRFGGSRKPFRFENMWLKMDGFVDLIKVWWEGFNFRGYQSFVLYSKLKSLKQNLRVWNREVFGDLGFRKSDLLVELANLDGLDERGIIDEAGRDRRLEVSKELEKLISMEEMCWRQKFRAFWLKEGDRCTKFFHRVANSNRRANLISRLEVEGDVVEDLVEIFGEIVAFYSSLYEEPFA